MSELKRSNKITDETRDNRQSLLRGWIKALERHKIIN